MKLYTDHNTLWITTLPIQIRWPLRHLYYPHLQGRFSCKSSYAIFLKIAETHSAESVIKAEVELIPASSGPRADHQQFPSAISIRNSHPQFSSLVFIRKFYEM